MSTPQTPPDNDAASLAAALVARIGPLAQAASHAKQGIAVDRERYAGAGEADALIDTVVSRVDELEADCRRLMQILGGFESAATSPQTAPAIEAPAVVQPEPAAVANPVSPAPQPVAPVPESEVRAPEPVAPTPEPASPAPEQVTVTPDAGAPAPSAEPTPAEEASGIVSYPGASAAPAPSGHAPLAAPPVGDPVVAEPPATAPVAIPGIHEADELDMPPPLGSPVSPDAAEQPPAAAPEAAAPEPAAAEPEAAAPASEPGETVHVSEGVRLLATQMSVAGASSADIARRLHNDFGVQDADRLIAQLFGPGPQG